MIRAYLRTERRVRGVLVSAVLEYLPRGNTLSDDAWHKRHFLLLVVLAGHLPALFLFGVLRGYAPNETAEVLAVPLACLILGRVMRGRRTASIFVTLGLVYCSATLVGLSAGAIEAHFHFFIMIGFIALYQDWVPFLLNVVFTVLSHGIGSSLVPGLMFNHSAAQSDPWTWSLIHGLAVLAACVGVVLFWRTTEDEQVRSLRLTEQLAEAELGRRKFTSDLLVNLARRNQNLLYRQLGLINRLEDKERDPDALSDLFTLDHLATRIRRNAESLLVLSGEESPRTWRGSVLLVDLVRAAIAETEDLDRVDFAIDESLAVTGRVVADFTHLLAELLENAVHFSPPGVTVMVRSRPSHLTAGAQVITIEDWGIGMASAELADANGLLRLPREVDLSVSKRLGLHVVARLAQRHRISVELTATPGGGVTAVVLLPPALFVDPEIASSTTGGLVGTQSVSYSTANPVDDTSDMQGAGRSRAQLLAPVEASRPTDLGPGSQVPGPPSPTGLTRQPLPVPAFDDAVATAGTDASSPEEAAVGRPAGRQPVPPLPSRRPAAIETSRPFEDAPVPDRPGRTIGRGWSDWWTPHNASLGRSDVEGQPGRLAGVPMTGPDDGGAPPEPASAAGQRPWDPYSESTGAASGLKRRIPQSHLAPGLRREKTIADEQAAAIRDPVAARNALSRFQASQRVGREAAAGGPDLDASETRTSW